MTPVSDGILRGLAIAWVIGGPVIYAQSWWQLVRGHLLMAAVETAIAFVGFLVGTLALDKTSTASGDTVPRMIPHMRRKKG